MKAFMEARQRQKERAQMGVVQSGFCIAAIGTGLTAVGFAFPKLATMKSSGLFVVVSGVMVRLALNISCLSPVRPDLCLADRNSRRCKRK